MRQQVAREPVSLEAGYDVSLNRLRKNLPNLGAMSYDYNKDVTMNLQQKGISYVWYPM